MKSLSKLNKGVFENGIGFGGPEWSFFWFPC